MIEIFAFRGIVRGWFAPVLGVVSVLVLMGTAGGASGSDCPEAIPADEFSEKIDSLLGAVEGSDFPSDSNLDSWYERRPEIHEHFAEILDLTSSDIVRRRAAVQALIAAESLSASPDEGDMLGTALARGEVRAWARQVLKDYASMGATGEDWMLVDADFVTDLKGSWKDQEALHTHRTLPLYQEKAAALRDLAWFRKSPSCE